MAYNGSGTWILPVAPTFPAVAGEVIYADRFNAIINDIKSALGQVLVRDGQAPMIGVLNLNNFQVQGLPVATTAGQAVEYSQYIAGFTNATFISPIFVNPTTNTPPSTAATHEVPDAAWVRDLFGTVPPGSLPATLGKTGQFLQVISDSPATLGWNPGFPDFLLMQQGVV